MKLNKEMIQVFELALESGRGIVAADLMRLMQVSKSTAYALLDSCKYWLHQKGVAIDRVKNKKSLLLSEEAQKQTQALLNAITPADYDYSAAERRLYYFFLLTEQKYLKIHQICELFGISRNTCIADIPEINKLLQRFEVKISSSSSGYTLCGREYDIRRAILYFVSMLESLGHSNRGSGGQRRSSYIYSLYGLQYHRILGRIDRLQQAAKAFGINPGLNTVYLVAATLEVFFYRLRQQAYLKPDTLPCCHGLEHSSQNVHWLLNQAEIVDEVSELLLNDSSLAPLERSLVGSAENECMVRMCICAGASRDGCLESFTGPYANLHGEATHIITRFEQLAGIRFDDKDVLFESIVLQLEAMLFRLKYGFYVFDPMEEKVKRDYFHILNITKQVLSSVSCLPAPVNDAEGVAFALQFMGWMYKSTRITNQSARILIVCPNSVGTGALLQSQIQKLLPSAQISTEKAANLSEITQNFDFILSTVPLPQSTLPVIVVNPLLTPYDKERIERQICGKFSQILDIKHLVEDIMALAQDYVESQQLPLFQNRLEELLRNNRLRIFYDTENEQMLNDLITIQRVQIVKSVENWQEAIRLASVPLVEDGSITEEYVQAMIDSVKEIGPYIVLAPGIALPHARPEAGVNRLAMSLLRVDEKVYFDDGQKYANLFFVLASVDGSSHLEALKQMSKIFRDETALEFFMGAEDPAGMVSILERYR